MDPLPREVWVPLVNNPSLERRYRFVTTKTFIFLNTARLSILLLRLFAFLPYLLFQNLY